jgi:hypothetical protein
MDCNILPSHSRFGSQRKKRDNIDKQKVFPLVIFIIYPAYLTGSHYPSEMIGSTQILRYSLYILNSIHFSIVEFHVLGTVDGTEVDRFS